MCMMDRSIMGKGSHEEASHQRSTALRSVCKCPQGRKQKRRRMGAGREACLGCFGLREC